jgi:hypothetical protein
MARRPMHRRWHAIGLAVSQNPGVTTQQTIEGRPAEYGFGEIWFAWLLLSHGVCARFLAPELSACDSLANWYNQGGAPARKA